MMVSVMCEPGHVELHHALTSAPVGAGWCEVGGRAADTLQGRYTTRGGRPLYTKMSQGHTSWPCRYLVWAQCAVKLPAIHGHPVHCASTSHATAW